MFDYFFDTKFTIPDGMGFEQFSFPHFCELAITALICVLASIKYRKLEEKGRRKFIIIIAILLILDEIAKDVVTGVTGHFRIDFLPFHLCSINIFVVAAYAIRPTDKKAEWLYAVCLPSAMMALLCPGWSVLPIINFMHLHSLSCHIMLVMVPIMLLSAGFRPQFRRLLRDLPTFLIVMVIVFFFNKIFGTDFMYLNGGGNGGSGNPLTFLQAYVGPFYLLGIPVICCLLWLVLYGVPRLISSLLKKKH